MISAPPPAAPSRSRPPSFRSCERPHRQAKPGATPRRVLLSHHDATANAVGSRRLLVLLVVVDFGELRIDDILLGPAGRSRRAAIASGCALLGLLVHRLAKLHRGLGERIGLGFDRLGVI